MHDGTASRGRVRHEAMLGARTRQLGVEVSSAASVLLAGELPTLLEPPAAPEHLGTPQSFHVGRQKTPPCPPCSTGAHAADAT